MRQAGRARRHNLTSFRIILLELGVPVVLRVSRQPIYVAVYIFDDVAEVGESLLPKLVPISTPTECHMHVLHPGHGDRLPNEP